MRLLLALLLGCSLLGCLVLGPAPAGAAAATSSPARLVPTDDVAPVREGTWPLRPRPQVVRGFDPPRTRWGAGHRGVDLLGHDHQVVHTSLAGTVSFASPLAGRGVVVVDHGGIRTTYEPVAASVSVGDRLGRGDAIGSLRRAGSHCFPRTCLHWGLLRGDSYLDPLVLVGAGPVRLLPLDTVAGVPQGAWRAPSALSPPPWPRPALSPWSPALRRAGPGADAGARAGWPHGAV
jgi:murein DD-endopeptidase MepM/ murein hydrolase activator NlpD